MLNPTVVSYNSWKLTSSQEILVDIKHSLNGLRRGTILKSKSRDLTWKVNSRTIFIQTEQKRFEGETEHLQHFSFKPIEALFEFEKQIANKESQGIYQYGLLPISHSDKPLYGEELEVIFE